MTAEATIGSGPETKRPLQQGMKPNLGRYWTDQEIINAVAYLKSTHPKLWAYLLTDAVELTYLSEGDGYFPMCNALEQLHPGLGIGGYGNLIVGVTNALFNELNLAIDQTPGIEEWGSLGTNRVDPLQNRPGASLTGEVARIIGGSSDALQGGFGCGRAYRVVSGAGQRGLHGV